MILTIRSAIAIRSCVILIKTNCLQMLCGHRRQCDRVSNGLVESRVGTGSKQRPLVSVLHEIFDVPHLVVDRPQVILVHHCTHHYSVTNIIEYYIFNLFNLI